MLRTRPETGTVSRSVPQASPSHTVAVLWPVVFLPPLTFRSLVLGPGLNRFVAEAQNFGKSLHLLEAEIFLSVKSPIEYTELGL